MNKFQNKFVMRLALITALCIQTAHGLTAPLLTTGGSTTTSFVVSATSAVFHRPSGTWFVGLLGGTGQVPTGANTISYASRPLANTTPTFTGIMTGDTVSSIQNRAILNMALLDHPTTPNTVSTSKIVFTAASGPVRYDTAVHVLTTTGGVAFNRTAVDITPAACSAIYALQAGNTNSTDGGTSCIFAAVQGNGQIPEKSTYLITTATTSGVAVMTVNNTTLAPTNGTTRALSMSVTYSLNIGRQGTAPVATNSTPSMAYDADTNRLYVGFQELTTDATHGTKNPIVSIAIFDVQTDSGAARLTQLPPFTATLTANLAVSNGNRNMINTLGVSQAVSAQNIAVMTTSPLSLAGGAGTNGNAGGKKLKYLIVNGGNGTAANTGNRVWAIPLVNPGNATVAGSPSPNTAATYVGVFANVNTANFSTPAAAAADLYISTSAAATVGAGPLPVATAARVVQSMYVDGDVVYCSLAPTQNNANEGGVFASQALFDQFGKIAGWTEWHRVSPTLDSTVTTGNPVTRFVVDAVDGQLWMVNGGAIASPATGAAGLDAFRTTLTRGTSSGLDLTSQLNLAANVGNGCTSVLDLNSSFTPWGTTTAQRVALFGGVLGKVCFAITGSAAGGNTIYPAANSLFTSNTGIHNQFIGGASNPLDYSKTNTLLLTTISGVGTVRCLGYTNWFSVSGNVTPGFFLAGVESNSTPTTAPDSAAGGLYAYARASLGVGFDPRRFAGLRSDVGLIAGNGTNAFSWQKLTLCYGNPVKIASAGQALYVLTQQDDGTGNRTDRIFRAIKQSTAAAINTSFIVTASSGQAPTGGSNLSSVTRIYDFIISQTGAGAEQLTMYTNDGIYTTSAITGVDNVGFNNAPASAQLNCGWTRMSTPATVSTFQLNGFRPTHTEDRRTQWFLRWAANASNTAIYNTMIAEQLNRAQTGFRPFALNPSALFSGTANGSTSVTLGIARLFFSDGLRRFIATLQNGKFVLQTIPANTATTAWNSGPNTLTNTALNGNMIYWISPIGDSGTFMIGMDTGVATIN